ncbi:hypothetical protein BFJ66_g17829 [Fusarium oxysporum f. sp. cepae]|nr:hypothetical protein BFJ66_g17829 [Fusarium oxysporum f. sp. cepae]
MAFAFWIRMMVMAMNQLPYVLKDQPAGHSTASQACKRYQAIELNHSVRIQVTKVKNADFTDN